MSRAAIAIQAARVAVLYVAVAVLAGIALLYLTQDRFVYYPTRYDRPDPEMASPRQVTRVVYRSPEGGQVAFYAAPPRRQPARAPVADGDG